MYYFLCVFSSSCQLMDKRGILAIKKRGCASTWRHVQSGKWGWRGSKRNAIMCWQWKIDVAIHSWCKRILLCIDDDGAALRPTCSDQANILYFLMTLLAIWSYVNYLSIVSHITSLNYYFIIYHAFILYQNHTLTGLSSILSSSVSSYTFCSTGAVGAGNSLYRSIWAESYVGWSWTSTGSAAPALRVWSPGLTCRGLEMSIN